MKDGLQTLEDGDCVERPNAEWIRQNIPLYEIIWQRYIGHDGKGQALVIAGLTEALKTDRERIYQAHYSCMFALIQLRDICEEYQISLGRVSSVSDYVRLQRDIASFMCFMGRVRDMMKKMDSALHLGGEVWKRFADFYQQRSNYLHGPIPAQHIDSDGLVSIAVPAGVSASETDWLDESRWSDADLKRYVEVADFMRGTLNELLDEVNAASSHFLEALKARMPHFVSLPERAEIEGSPFEVHLPSGTGQVQIKSTAAASSCFHPSREDHF